MTGHLKTASIFIGLLLICSCESKKKEEGKASAEAAAQEKVAACPYSVAQPAFHHPTSAPSVYSAVD